MSFYRVLLLLGLSVLAIGLNAEPNKQALKYIRDGAYVKAEDQINKSLEKDSINPGGHYLYGLLYVQPLFERYNLDSSYYHTLLSQEQWVYFEDKERQKLAKIGIVKDSIDQLRADIEVLAYGRARELMSLEAFNLFFSSFDNDSLDVLLTFTRDSLAFAQSSNVNTWQVYKTFMSNYPDAKQWAEAEKKYHILAYEARAKGKSVEKTEKFLNEVPDTPYRALLEKRLLLTYTVVNKPGGYMKFLNKYPTSVHRKLAIDALYFVSLASKNFNFPKHLETDSITFETKVSELKLIPFLSGNKYGFFSATDGSEIIKATYSGVDEKYLCSITDDLLLLVSEVNDQLVISKSGKVLPLAAEGLENISKGLYKIEKKGYEGCILASGQVVVDATYNEVKAVDNRFITVRKNGRWGLFSFLGKQLLATDYDEIEYFGNDILILTKGKKVALLNVTSFLSDGFNDGQINFIYDEIDQAGSYLMCFSGESESLLNFELKTIIPAEKHEIHVENEFVYTKSKWGIKLFNRDKKQLGDELYQDVRVGGGKIAVKKNNQWNLFMDGFGAEPLLNIDSVYFINDQASVVTASGTRKLFFNNGESYVVAAGQKVEIVENSQTNAKTDYLLIRKANNYFQVLSSEGKALFEIKGLGIEQASDSLYLLKTKKGMQLIDHNGENVLNDTYDLIETQMQKGLLTFHLLDNGKLGLYQQNNKDLIKADYIEKIKVLNDSIYVAKQESGMGLINMRDKKKREFKFSELKILNDSLILVKDTENWILQNIITEDVLLDKIVQVDDKIDYGDFQQIKFREQQGYGLLDSRVGVVLPAIYNEIKNIGDSSSPYLFVERFLSDSDFYIVLYINKEGKKIKSVAYKEDENANILCEN